MKKFQLRIVIEQKQTWRVIQSSNRESSTPATVEEQPALLPIKEANTAWPEVYRRNRLFNSLSVCLTRLVLILRLVNRKD